MKSLLGSLMIVALVSFAQEATAQKKVRTFKVEKILDLPADKVWAVVGEDYGAIANSHPAIVESHYINGSLKAGEGAERVCNFNDKGTRFLKEKMLEYKPEEMSFINQVYQAGKFPVDPEYTRALYKVEDLGDGRSKLSFDMQYRTKPAWMGGMMKRSFRKLINNYFIAIEHHARTGEAVNKENFKEIKKQYKS